MKTIKHWTPKLIDGERYFTQLQVDEMLQERDCIAREEERGIALRIVRNSQSLAQAENMLKNNLEALTKPLEDRE